MTDISEAEEYRIVRNDEDQYSILPVDMEIPSGWHAIDYSGPKTACMSRIDEIWTDMRPSSLRKAMDGGADIQAARP